MSENHEGIEKGMPFQLQTNLIPPMAQFQPMNQQHNQLNFFNQNGNLCGNGLQTNQLLIKQAPFQIQNGGQSQMSNTLESLLKDTSARVSGIFAFQSKMLTDLQEKSNLQAQTIGILFEEVKQLKNLLVKEKTDIQTQVQGIENGNSPIYSQLPNSRSLPCSEMSPEGLIAWLFKRKESEYKYKLILNTSLDQPLYRERNFSINVSLVDRQDNIVNNNQRIPLCMQLYTSEQPPKFIETNTSGNKILKGQTEKDLSHGQLFFEKIQIKEVTSHFRNGWLFLVILPKTLQYNSGKTTQRIDDIDHNQIRPLVIEKLIVKAKKLKDSKKNRESPHDESKEHRSHEKIEDIN